MGRIIQLPEEIADTMGYTPVDIIFVFKIIIVCMKEKEFYCDRYTYGMSNTIDKFRSICCIESLTRWLLPLRIIMRMGILKSFGWCESRITGKNKKFDCVKIKRLSH